VTPQSSGWPALGGGPALHGRMAPGALFPEKQTEKTNQMNAELKTITPAYAKKLLGNNIGNRPIAVRHVENIAKELKGGRWQVNGDTIKIGVSGRLLDGQHRLTAVVKTGISIQTWVIYGFIHEDDIFPAIDGVIKKRRGSDTLGCLGEKNTNRLASALVLVDKYMTGRVEKSVNYSNGEVAELITKYPEVRNSIQTGAKSTKLIIPSVLDACHYLFSLKDPEMADLFWDRVRRGSGLEEGEPEYVLRERLLANSLAKAKLSKAHLFALCIKAWNYARVGKKIRNLRLCERDGKMIEFPVIE
jgi:hypothetical protein